MQHYTIKQRVLIVKRYHQDSESFIATIRKVGPMFGRNNVPNSSTVKRIIEKFESTGSVSDVKHKTRARRGRSEQNIMQGRESVTESPQTSIYNRAQELDNKTASLQRILTKDLQLHAYKVQLTQQRLFAVCELLWY